MTGERIQLEHGAGGGLSQELTGGLIAAHLGPARARRTEGGGPLELDTTRIALTTDSFSIDPIFFGNGDIGKLAVCGTVNDLAVSGAHPRYLSLSLVLEEGLPMADLARVLDSVRDAAVEVGIEVLTGETRVLRGGEVDRLSINTVGVGEFTHELDLGVASVRPGDAVIVTGWLGNHGVHILSLRRQLGFERSVLSDCAALDGLVWNLMEEYEPQVHCMREMTRGGLGTVLNELAVSAGVSIEVEEHCLPIRRETRTAASVLGVDPLYLENEGCICVFVDNEVAIEVLELIRWQPQGRAARIIGTVREGAAGVTLVSPDGAATLVELLADDQLPRLC
jgi:hydrogenase expression/formation protein HypE